MTRWSNDSEKYAHVRMAMVSSPSGPVITFGRFSIAPMPRIAVVGTGMIGVPMSEPNTPGFVIVNVASWTSSGRSFFARARVARSFSCRVRPTSESSSACLMTGTMSPQSSATAMPRLYCLR